MLNIDGIDTDKAHTIWCDNDEKKSVELRKQVNHMYFAHHISKSAVARSKGVSKKFVIKWTKSPDQDCSVDMRGWTKGTRRKWDALVETTIREIHRHLESDPHQFFTGATAIAQEWKARYPGTTLPPVRTIGKIMSDLGLAGEKPRIKRKGASRYLCYPEYTVYTCLGKRVLEADFIGKKYITGRTAPINFIGFSFKKEPRLRYFRRIEGQTAMNFIRECSAFFERFERPDCIKVDNALATIGSASGKRNISKAMSFLLKNTIYPIFAVPRKPFSQASIEGNNSVFSRKFWNRISFSSLKEIDEKLEWFNEASLHYTGYQSCPYEKNNNFIPRVYFIRQVQDDQKTRDGYIHVLNEKIALPSSYANYFVLAEWDITEEHLSIYFEKDQKSEVIERVTFRINEQSKKALQRR
jgi:transposase